MAFGDFPCDPPRRPVQGIERTAGFEFLPLDHQPVAAREGAALGQWRVEHDDQRHLFARCAQLLRHFIGGDAAA